MHTNLMRVLASGEKMQEEDMKTWSEGTLIYF